MKYGRLIEYKLGRKALKFPLVRRRTVRQFYSQFRERTAQQTRRDNVRWYRICLGRAIIFPSIGGCR